MPLFFWFDLFLEARAEILEKIWLVFWKIWRHQKNILKLTDLPLNSFLPVLAVYFAVILNKTWKKSTWSLNREITLIPRHSIQESDHRISVCGEITRSLEAKSWNEWDIERTAKYSLSFSRSLTDKIYTFSMIRVDEIIEFLSLCISSEIIISRNTNSPFRFSEFWQLGFTHCFFLGTEYSKTLGCRGSRGH